jgi:hypothetical protein
MRTLDQPFAPGRLLPRQGGNHGRVGLFSFDASIVIEVADVKLLVAALLVAVRREREPKPELEREQP